MVTEGTQPENGIIAMDGPDESQEPDLEFQDDQLQHNTLSSLNMMRKNRHFCDVVLHVGNAEVHAHRAVLASVSPYLFELFTTDQDNKRTENVITYKLNGGFDKNAMQLLVDYAYTGKLEVLYHQVKAVYLAACQLKIDTVIKECARHLIKNLSIENCIDIRSLPGIARNKTFVQQVDAYISKEFSSLSQNPGLLSLFCARIEVLNQTKQEMTLVNHNSLCQLVLEWIKRQITDESLSTASLSEKTFMLYLAIDNSLQDCSSLPNGDVSDSDIVQDYKKMSLKGCQPNKKAKKKCLGQPSKPRVLIYSRDIGECLETEFEPDWNVIASSKVGDHSFLALVTILGKLSTLSIQLRLNTPSTPSPVMTPEASRPASEEKPDLYCVLANMTSGRCAVGCANIHGKLLVCGGYDRIECLKTVEQYLPESNIWRPMPTMREARGRFQIAVLGNKVFAVGGSNGTTELDTVEMLDLESPDKWVKATRLPFAKSNAGVCALDNKIYCVGGWNGQVGIKQCDVFDPETVTWGPIAHLNVGRYQAGVTSYNNYVYAIGGCDSWNCLSSVEVYDPRENAWTFTKSIITARRGCGVAVFQGKLYAIGGSDGSHSLSSTEVYDPETQSWVVGPSLTTPRANVSVAVVGDRLYAVGGFSGKAFLNTIEYLDANSKEWTTFIPKLHSVGIVDKNRLGSEGSGNTSEDNQSDGDDIKDEDKKIVGYNYESNDIKIIDYNNMTRGTTEEALNRA